MPCPLELCHHAQLRLQPPPWAPQVLVTSILLSVSLCLTSLDAFYEWTHAAWVHLWWDISLSVIYT